MLVERITQDTYGGGRRRVRVHRYIALPRKSGLVPYLLKLHEKIAQEGNYKPKATALTFEGKVIC